MVDTLPSYDSSIVEFHRVAEQTPSPFNASLPSSGSLPINEAVINCAFVLSKICLDCDLSRNSFSNSWNEHRACTGIWQVVVGKDRKDHGPTAQRRGKRLFFESLPTRRFGATYVRRGIRIPESHSRRFSRLRAEAICMGQISPGHARDVFFIGRISIYWRTGS